MKFLLALTVLFSTAFLLTGADAAGVTYVGHDKVMDSLNKGGTLVEASNLKVSGSHRDKAGRVEVHDKETDILHVIDGEATFVTGGTMVGGKVTGPDQHLGTDITGGTSHHLTTGDVIVVPAGTPHWFKEVPKSVSFFVVKVIKQ